MLTKIVHKNQQCYIVSRCFKLFNILRNCSYSDLIINSLCVYVWIHIFPSVWILCVCVSLSNPPLVWFHPKRTLIFWYWMGMENKISFVPCHGCHKCVRAPLPRTFPVSVLCLHRCCWQIQVLTLFLCRIIPKCCNFTVFILACSYLLWYLWDKIFVFQVFFDHY